MIAPRVVVLPPKRKASTGEYVVRVLLDGKRCEERCYYTDDKGDARATWAAMVAEADAENNRTRCDCDGTVPHVLAGGYTCPVAFHNDGGNV